MPLTSARLFDIAGTFTSEGIYPRLFAMVRKVKSATTPAPMPRIRRRTGSSSSSTKLWRTSSTGSPSAAHQGRECSGKTPRVRHLAGHRRSQRRVGPRNPTLPGIGDDRRGPVRHGALEGACAAGLLPARYTVSRGTAAALVRFHPALYAGPSRPRPPKGIGFPIPVEDPRLAAGS